MAGAEPSFSDVHLQRTLLKLSDCEMGRKALVDYLGVGEGSVRTIIKRLSEQGLVRSSNRGHMLTSKGKKHADRILERLSKPFELDSFGFLPGRYCVVLVSDCPTKRNDWINMRDYAIKCGADGAMLLVNDGVLSFPGSQMRLEDYPRLKKALEVLLRPDTSIIIVSFSPYLSKAEDAALGIAQKLINA